MSTIHFIHDYESLRIYLACVILYNMMIVLHVFNKYIYDDDDDDDIYNVIYMCMID